MKKLFLLLFTISFSLSVIGQDSGLGLGVILGEPSGLSAKLWTSQKTALDAGVAWSFINVGFFHVHADLLIHSFSIDIDQGKLPVYFGLGGKIVLSRNLGMAVRVPFGIAYLFESAPVDIFLEIVPMLELLPATGIGFEGGIGVRYFF